ncbi:uncharacterized protein LOC132740539 [Ruditapes philippinarum]|uniref:uncharacterized protein LOC132740539 n=1 Tax=Ruditapes philippinarum TaxID=129788 RepID=UPI00295A68EB|nr:uncharacterized protein LOC132740539 [Ruditapes philippinarum]
MANNKQTVRKLSPKTLCPICKDLVLEEKFLQHIMLCKKNNARLCCVTCKMYFKKEIYRSKHMKRVHSTETTDKETPSTSQECCKIGDEDSDWDRDPDIEICEEKTDNVTDQKKETEDLELIKIGRLYRKRTLPNPVIAPVTRKCPKLDNDIEQENKLDPAVKSCSSVEDLPDNPQGIDNSGSTDDNNINNVDKRECELNYDDSKEDEEQSDETDIDTKEDEVKETDVPSSSFPENSVAPSEEKISFEIEKEKLEIEKKKIDLETAKFEFKKNMLTKLIDIVSDM